MAGFFFTCDFFEGRKGSRSGHSAQLVRPVMPLMQFLLATT